MLHVGKPNRCTVFVTTDADDDAVNVETCLYIKKYSAKLDAVSQVQLAERSCTRLVVRDREVHV